MCVGGGRGISRTLDMDIKLTMLDILHQKMARSNIITIVLGVSKNMKQPQNIDNSRDQLHHEPNLSDSSLVNHPSISPSWPLYDLDMSTL